jgi:nucleoside 2-deoxyribosyltransferase
MSPQTKYDIYIAAPFFNHEQTTIVANIEFMCDENGLTYYSPRKHSGSRLLRPEDRRVFDKWKPILQSNIDAIQQSRCILAVIEYAMPNGTALVAGKQYTAMANPSTGTVWKSWKVPDDAKPIELPDAGVIWECGNAFARNIPIFAFHRTKCPNEMNLMLSHTVVGMLTGFDRLTEFLKHYDGVMHDPMYDTTGLWAKPTSEVI